MTYHSDAPEETFVTPPEKSPVHEGKYPIPEDVWYTDGSSKGNLSKWRAIAYHPSTEMIWFIHSYSWQHVLEFEYSSA